MLVTNEKGGPIGPPFEIAADEGADKGSWVSATYRPDGLSGEVS